MRPAPMCTTSSTRSTCGCTTTSAGARTRPCTGCGRSGTGPWPGGPREPAGHGRAPRRGAPRQPGDPARGARHLDVGQRQRRRPRRRRLCHQALGRVLRRPDRRAARRGRPGGRAGRGRGPAAVGRQRNPSLPLPGVWRDRRRHPHPLVRGGRVRAGQAGHPRARHDSRRRLQRADPRYPGSHRGAVRHGLRVQHRPGHRGLVRCRRRRSGGGSRCAGGQPRPVRVGRLGRGVAEERDHLRGGRADGHPDAGAEPARRCPAVSARAPLPPQARTRRVLRKPPSWPARSTALMTPPTAQDDFEVWFLTGSQHLYGEETLRQVAEQSRGIADQLSHAQPAGAPAIPAKLVWKPVLTDHDAIRRTILEANADDRVIGLVAWMHTFSPAKMWIAGLSALDKPLLHLHTQANVALPWATIDMDFMNLNQAAHGDREFGYIQTRLRVARVTVAGHAKDERTRRAVERWARVSMGIDDLRTLRVARFGDNMRDVAVTEGDKVEAQQRFGVSVNTYGVNDLVGVVDGVEPGEIDKLIQEYCDLYVVQPELLPGGDRHEALRYGARIEAGLRTFLDAGDFHAFTTNFEDLGGLRQLPGLAVQRLMADGYGFGGEGDWKTAMLLRTLKTVG